MARAIFALALLAQLLSGKARADQDAWFAAGSGCGARGAFDKSGRAADLPGCTGKLPKNAPRVELLLHDAKRDLVEAEELVGKGKADKAEALLAPVEAALKEAPPFHPELPDRWEQAVPMYRRVVASVRNRARLLAHLDKLKQAREAALEAGRSKDTDPAAAVKAAQACLGALSEARAAGVDFTLPVELEKDHLRPLAEAQAECEQHKKAAEPILRAREAAMKAARARFRKKLRGDRLKTFDAHPDAMPEVMPETAAAPPKGKKGKPVRLVTWRYKTKDGEERFVFAGDKLVK